MNHCSVCWCLIDEAVKEALVEKLSSSIWWFLSVRFNINFFCVVDADTLICSLVFDYDDDDDYYFFGNLILGRILISLTLT